MGIRQQPGARFIIESLEAASDRRASPSKRHGCGCI